MQNKPQSVEGGPVKDLMEAKRIGDNIFLAGMLSTGLLVGCLNIQKTSGIDVPKVKETTTPVDLSDTIQETTDAWNSELKEVLSSPVIYLSEKAGCTIQMRQGEYVKDGKKHVLLHVADIISPTYQPLKDQERPSRLVLIKNTDVSYLSITRMSISRPAASESVTLEFNMLMPAHGENQIVITGSNALSDAEIEALKSSGKVENPVYHAKYDFFIPEPIYVTWGFYEGDGKSEILNTIMYRQQISDDPTTHLISRNASGSFEAKTSFGK